MNSRYHSPIAVAVLALDLAAGAVPGVGAQKTTGGSQASAQAAAQAATQAGPGSVTLENLAPRYFDLLDFMRTKALGRNFVTPVSERRRVADLVSVNWVALDRGTQARLISMAEMGGGVAADFAARSETDRKNILADWRRIVLSPLMLYAPPAYTQNYSKYGLSFVYPAAWGLAEGQSFVSPLK